MNKRTIKTCRTVNDLLSQDINPDIQHLARDLQSDLPNIKTVVLVYLRRDGYVVSTSASEDEDPELVIRGLFSWGQSNLDDCEGD